MSINVDLPLEFFLRMGIVVGDGDDDGSRGDNSGESDSEVGRFWRFW